MRCFALRRVPLAEGEHRPPLLSRPPSAKEFAFGEREEKRRRGKQGCCLCLCIYGAEYPELSCVAFSNTVTKSDRVLCFAFGEAPHLSSRLWRERSGDASLARRDDKRREIRRSPSPKARREIRCTSLGEGTRRNKGDTRDAPNLSPRLRRRRSAGSLGASASAGYREKSLGTLRSRERSTESLVSSFRRFIISRVKAASSKESFLKKLSLRRLLEM